MKLLNRSSVVTLSVALTLLTSVASANDANQKGLKAIAKVVDTTIADYQYRAQFPDHAQPIRRGAKDPVAMKQVSNVHHIRDNSHTDLVLAIKTEANFFQYPEPVKLNLEVQNRDGSIAGSGPRNQVATIEALVLNQAGEEVTTFKFTPTGKGREYSANFSLPRRFIPAIAENFLVQVRTVTKEGYEFKGSTGFLYSNPQVQLLPGGGIVSDDSGVTAYVNVKVNRAGTFYLAGSLYDEKSQPFAWSQTRTELKRGVQRVALNYPNSVLAAHSYQGALTLGEVTLKNVSSMPNGPAKVEVPKLKTKQIDTGKLAKETFVNPRLDKSVQGLEKLKGKLVQRLNDTNSKAE